LALEVRCSSLLHWGDGLDHLTPFLVKQAFKISQGKGKMEEELSDQELREITRRKQKEIRQEEWTPKKIEREVRRASREKEDYERWKRPRAKKREYLFDIMPRWIKHSDLPEYLNQKNGEQAWNILSCLISLDCRFNPNGPDWFSQSYREIAKLTGTCEKTVRRVINKLEKAGYISVIRGEFKGLKSSFKISDSLPTPKGPNSIKAVNGGFLGRRGKEPSLRYYQRGTQCPPLDEKRKGDI